MAEASFIVFGFLAALGVWTATMFVAKRTNTRWSGWLILFVFTTPLWLSFWTVGRAMVAVLLGLS